MDHSNSKEFLLSSWAIDNRITIFLLSIAITLGGLVAYMTLPKENFPEILWPVIYVSTPYPGTSAQDVENLITRKIEKEIKGIEGIKKINSTSIQDYSMIFVEFETDVDIPEAKTEVKDAVDKAKSELPSDLPNDPEVIDINFSEIPVMFINLSGNFDNVTLKKYAEELQDELESMKEILRADIVGAREREIQVNVDLQQMENAQITLDDIESAIASEHVIVSGGEIDIDNQKIAVRVNAEFQDVRELEDLIVQSSQGSSVYLKDMAQVVDGFEDVESYARLDGKPVITINVIKKAGENLVDASAKIKAIVKDYQENKFPPSLNITFSADTSILTNNMLNELINTIILGFILVTLVLMFFMGIRDALFVGLAVPLSSFISFIALPSLGYSMNLVVLFSFILAMGIVVDNAIVVIENTYRIYMEKSVGIVTAAKKAAGEVIGPVFAGTLTTICPFLPLLFWSGPVGEFMGFLPVVMIITLFASLFVAYVINPVFAVTFMRKQDPEAPTSHKRMWFFTGTMILIALICYLIGSTIFANFLIFIVGFTLFYTYILHHAVLFFQQRLLPSIKNGYKNLISWSLEGWHAFAVLSGALLFLIFSVVIFASSNLKVVQFPESDPNFIYVYNEMPNGTDIEVTDSITQILEDRVYEVLGENNPLIKYVITNVSIGAGDANSFDQNSPQPHKSKLTIEFVPSKDRGDVSTWEILEEIREKVKGIAGTKITVDKEATGPPGAAPIELTLTSEEFMDLTRVSEDLISYLDSLDIPGVEQLKLDLDEKRPQLLINIDRDKARRLGVSSFKIGSVLRTAIFGKEAAQFRDKEDEYDIEVRAKEIYRNDIPSLMNMRITFMDQASGKLKSIPISSVADFTYTSEYGGINRKDLEKSVTISSNILSDYNANEVNEEIKFWINEFEKQGRKFPTVDLEVGGIIVEQQEEGGFLAGAFGAAILLIVMILVTQFNSFSNVLIIISQVVFSVIGVLLGYAITGMDFSVILSGVGLVVLSGIVVNNGIILLDFFQILRNQGVPLKEAVIEGGMTRLTPVLLTATSTMLGLVPLAIGFNINFGTLLSELDPQIFFGGDNAAFWKPLSWSIIFGLGFATFVTLVIIPVIYYLVKRTELWIEEKYFAKSEYKLEKNSTHSNGHNGLHH